MAPAIGFGGPSVLDDNRAGPLGDDGRANDLLAGQQVVAKIQRGLVAVTIAEHFHPGMWRRWLSIGRNYFRFVKYRLRSPHRFNGKCFNYQPSFFGCESKPLFMGLFKRLDHLLETADSNQQSRVGPFITKVCLALDVDGIFIDILGDDFRLHLGNKWPTTIVDTLQCRLVERAFQLHFPQRPDIGETHAIGGENPGKRMQKDTAHPQGIGHHTGMLTAGTAKTIQGILGYIVPALDGYFFDGIGHVFHGNAQKTFSHLLR